MTRSYGWRFLDMGRRIERRAHDSAAAAARGARRAGRTTAQLELLLELADSTMTYRARYHATPQLPPVLDLLLCDETNPRSAIFQIAALERAHRAPARRRRRRPHDARPAARRAALERAAARRPDASSARAVGRFDARVDLDGLRGVSTATFDQLSDHIARAYFSHPRRSASPVRGAAKRDVIYDIRHKTTFNTRTRLGVAPHAAPRAARSIRARRASAVAATSTRRRRSIPRHATISATRSLPDSAGAARAARRRRAARSRCCRCRRRSTSPRARRGRQSATSLPAAPT